MPETAPSLSERLYSYRRIAALGATAVALALGTAKAAEAEPSPPAIEPLPELIIAAQEDQLVGDNPEASVWVAERLKELGVNAVKFTAPWTYPAQCAEIDNDLSRFRNAFEALKDKDLIPIVNLIPGGGAGLGKAPVTPAQRTCYTDTLIAYEHLFKEVNPGGRIVFEVPNEPNYETFWQPQTDNKGERVAPRAVVNTLARAYDPVKKEAQKLGIGVTLVGGALGPKGAAGFTDAMGTARRGLNRKGAIMDAFSVHPYGRTNDEAPDIPHPDLSTVGLADLKAFIEVLDGSFRKEMSLWLTEYGAKVKVPKDKMYMYKNIKQVSPALISELEQAAYYSLAMKIARCSPRIGAIAFFNAIDDKQKHPDGGWWTSGLMYPDGTPKPAYEPLRQEIQQAFTDRSANC